MVWIITKLEMALKKSYCVPPNCLKNLAFISFYATTDEEKTSFYQ